MASPPFIINVTIPGDTDIVSQFPAVDRTHLDQINSWLKTDHNVNGTHKFATFLQVNVVDGGGTSSGVPTPAANNTAVYRDTDGALKMKRGEDSTVEFLQGVPPGVQVGYAGATLPTGWLWCDGTAVSRTTYARLFAAIGTTYGAGDGSTTFNVPDLNGRLIAYRDRTGANRITTAGSGVDGATLAAVGGAQNVTLISNNLPAHNHTASSGFVSSDHTHAFNVNSGNNNVDHTHTGSGTTSSGGVDHTHDYFDNSFGSGGLGINGGATAFIGGSDSARTTTGASAFLHTHTFSFTTSGASATHIHNVSGSTGGISANHNHVITVDNNVTTNTAVNKMPPVIVLNAIIRT